MRFVLKVLGLTMIFTVASWFFLAERTDEDTPTEEQAIYDPPIPPLVRPNFWEAPYEFESHDVSCILELTQDASVIKLRWRPLPTHRDYELQPTTTQIFETEYWPNAGKRLSPSVLIVCGVAPETENTIIERWTFEIDAETPRAYWIAGNIDTHWDLPKQLSVDRLYEGNQPGARHVRELIENRGAPGTYFASFHDSSDLYVIADGRATLVWPAAPNSKPLSMLSGQALVGGGFAYTIFFGPDNVRGSDLLMGEFAHVLDEEGDGQLDRSLSEDELAKISRNESVLSDF